MDKSPKKHPILSIIYRILGIIFILLLILTIALNLYFTPDRVKSLTESLIKQSFNRETRIGSFDLSLFRGLVAKQIEISNLPGFSSQPLLTIKEIDLQYNFWSIIKKKPQVYRIVVRDPVLSIEKNLQGNWNFTDLLESKLKDYQLNRIEIINATLLVRPYPEFNLSKTNITLQDIRPWKPWKFDIQGILTEQSESRIALSGALNVFTLILTGDINISVKSFNPMPMVKKQVQETQLAQLSLLSDANITISSPQSKPINITGAISATKIQHPILPKYQGNGQVEFTLSVSSDSGRIEIPIIKFTLDGFPELTATGNIDSLYGESTIQFAVRGKESKLQPLFVLFGKPYPSISGTGNIRLTHGDIFLVPSRNIVRIDSGISLSNLRIIDKQTLTEVHNGTMDIGLSYISPIGIGKNPMRINILADAEKILVNNISIKPDPVILKLELDRNLALTKLAIPSTKLMVGEAPISIQATGDKQKYLAKIIMQKFELARIPESLSTKTSFPKTNGLASGNLDITYIPSYNTSLSITGNFKINNLSIIQNNKSYTFGNIESDFDSLINIANHTISVNKLDVKSDRNLGIQGTAELHNYGRDHISGQFSFAPISVQELKSYLAMISPSSTVPALEGTIAGKGRFSYYPASQSRSKEISGRFDLSGSAIQYRSPSAFAAAKTSDINILFETKTSDILYSNASILFKGLELHYANNTILGDFKGTADIYTNAQFSQITGIINLDTTNINIPSSRIEIKGMTGKADFIVPQKDNHGSTIPFTSQLATMQIEELVNPWIEAKDISLSAAINPEKVMVNRLTAQIEGGDLNTQAEINLATPAKAYLKGSITNIKSTNIVQQLNASYPIPYTSTSGTISAEFDGNFDTISTGVGNLRLTLNKLNLVKDEITYLRKITADIGIDINQQKITIQPTQVDIEGKVKPVIAGHIDKLFSSTPVPELSIKLDTTSLSVAQDVFFEFLPSPLQDADISGIIAAAMQIGKSDKDWLLAGKINLNNLNLKMGDILTLSNLNGSIPLDSNTTSQSDFFPYRFRKEDYDSWLTELKQYAATNRAYLMIDSADASIISAKNLVLSPTISAAGAKIPLLKLNLFGGTVYGRALIKANSEYTLILLLNNLSLKQVCDSQDSIRGMLSGRFNGMMLLNGTERGLVKLRGIIQLWSIPSKTEPREFSKAFLEKAAGRKLPPLYIQRNYDEAKITLTIQDGYLMFNDFLMVGRMFGRPMTSIGIDPRGNKVSLINLLDWMNGLASGTDKIRTEIK